MNKYDPYEWVSKLEREQIEGKERELTILSKLEATRREVEATGLPEKIKTLCERLKSVVKQTCGYKDFGQEILSHELFHSNWGGRESLLVTIGGVGFSLKLSVSGRLTLYFFKDVYKAGSTSDIISFLPSEISDNDISEWFRFLIGDIESLNDVRVFRKYSKHVNWHDLPL